MSAVDERGTLTRKADVLKILKAGGNIHWRGPGKLYELTTKQGAVVPAWQNAIKSALSAWRTTPTPAATRPSQTRS